MQKTVFVHISALTTFNHYAGVDAVAQLEPRMADSFNELYKILCTGGTPENTKYPKVVACLAKLAADKLECQEGASQSPLLAWSRELWAHSQFPANVGVRTRVPRSLEIAQAYWMGVTQHSSLHPETSIALANLKKVAIRAIVIAPNDMRLRASTNSEKCDYNYDERFSSATTSKRYEAVLGKCIRAASQLRVGDLTGPSSTAFWRETLAHTGLKFNSRSKPKVWVVADAQTHGFEFPEFFPVQRVVVSRQSSNTNTLPRSNGSIAIASLNELFSLIHS